MLSEYKGELIFIQVNRIYSEDCFDTMNKIKSESIDLIIADPPYNIGKDFGNNSDRQSREQYLEFIKKQIVEYFRILKPNGSLMIYTGKQFNPYYQIEIEEYMTIQNNIIWFYDSSGAQAKIKYGKIGRAHV